MQPGGNWERVLIGDNISLLHSVTHCTKVEDLLLEDDVLISAEHQLLEILILRKEQSWGGHLVIENVSEGSTVVGVPSRQL